MEIVIAAVVVALGLAAGLVVAALLLAKRVPGFVGAAQARPRKPPKTAARDDADALAGTHAELLGSSAAYRTAVLG